MSQRVMSNERDGEAYKYYNLSGEDGGDLPEGSKYFVFRIDKNVASVAALMVWAAIVSKTEKDQPDVVTEELTNYVGEEEILAAAGRLALLNMIGAI